MKKIVSILAVAAMAAGAFALDLGGIKGTWQDSKWDADWTFSADGHIRLTKTSSGEEVYDFNDSSIQNFKVDAGTKGVTITFDCKETERSYSFTKGMSLSSDLDMVVTPHWDQAEYKTAINLKK